MVKLPGVSVIISTIGRDSLKDCLASILAQDYQGSIQIMLGLEHDEYGKFGELRRFLTSLKMPDRFTLTVIDVGYSTSVRNGGVHSNHFGGSMYSSLSFLAKYSLLVHIDDDDRFMPNHISSLVEVIDDKPWAFTLSYFTNHKNIIGHDYFESVGPGKGIFKHPYNGFVRPGGLMFNKTDHRILRILFLWSIGPLVTGDGNDRLIFNELVKLPYAETMKYTHLYEIDLKDRVHAVRVKHISAENPDIDFSALTQKINSVR